MSLFQMFVSCERQSFNTTISLINLSFWHITDHEVKLILSTQLALLLYKNLLFAQLHNTMSLLLYILRLHQFRTSSTNYD